MRKKLHKILVTGGAGFIGSEFVRQAINKGHNVVIVDKLTYAGDLARLQKLKGKHQFYKADIRSRRQMQSIFARERPVAAINFAAETHVDRSILDARHFLETNVNGTNVLLDISRKFGIKKLIHISSDEVYGEIIKGAFTEDSPLQPNSPYAASKAAADLLVKAHVRTYNLPAIIVRPCNNYGQWQYPEKLIPLVISKALRNLKVPVYSKGDNIREWLYVSDCTNAILLILEKGKAGEVYNLGSGHEERNIDVVKRILKILDKPKSLIKFVKDRPGHDFRYALDSSKIKDMLGWKPQLRFENGLKKTVSWYLNNETWINRHYREELCIKF